MLSSSPQIFRPDLPTPERPGTLAVPGSGPSRELLWMLVATLGLLLLQGCAAPGSDIHLAPLFTRLNTPDDAVETEALGGFYYSRREARPALLGDGELVQRALRPLWGWQKVSLNEERTDFLLPFGFWERKDDTVRSMLFPLYYWRSYASDWREDGRDPNAPREFDLISLPGLIWSKNLHGAHRLGFFPIYGQLNDFITYDRVTWALFPLYISVERGGEKLENFLWPIFGFTSKGYRNHWRIWPLYGVSEKPGTFSSRFALWPFFTSRRDFLSREEGKQRKSWMLWPLLGNTRIGTFSAWTFLWPFFGFASDSRGADIPGEKAYWAWDGPWPLLRLQNGGLSPLAKERTRLWPFYSYSEGDDLRWWTWAWPFVHKRIEESPFSRRASFYVVPVWQSWDLYRAEGVSPEKWRKLWPLFRHVRDGERRHSSFPALSPLPRSSNMYFYYNWIWELYAWESEGDRRKRRSWGALYRHESDAVESRSSIAGLWSARQVQTAAGLVRETSLLFGLLRWRSGPKQSDPGLMRPAFPGPGWPSEWGLNAVRPDRFDEVDG